MTNPGQQFFIDGRNYAIILRSGIDLEGKVRLSGKLWLYLIVGNRRWNIPYENIEAWTDSIPPAPQEEETQP